MLDSTLTVPSEPPFGPLRAADGTGTAQLIVLVGRDVGRRYVLVESQVIGRSGEAEVVADDEGASRRHASIQRIGPGAYELVDMGSRNGTYLNGARVKRAPLQFGDKIALGEGTVFLFTRQDAFEDRLLQAQRLQALAQIAGGIGHDFNNMLGAALTNVTHMQGLEHLEEESVRSSLQEVESAIRRAVGLTSQLLAFAQTRRPVMRPVDVSRVVQDATRLIRSTLDRTIVLRTTIDPDLGVQGDGPQLLQALMNLCINSGDAMPDGGSLAVSATREPPSGTRGESVLILVEDTGAGMDAVTRQRLFEPFFTTKQGARGAGMGLASVYAVIRDHGGTIEVRSEIGRGSRFEIRLPAVEPAQVRRHPSGPWPAAQPPRGGVVLLVDDEELVRFALGRVLVHAGLEVLSASDGREALDVYDEHGERIDVVILDLDMPVMDGGRAFKELRDRHPGVRVLISSGFSNPDRERELVEAGVTGVLRKPYDSNTLLRAVATVMDEG